MDEYDPRLRPWWLPWLAAALVAALLIGVGSYLVYGRGIGAASMTSRTALPQVAGYFAGQRIQFVHTEASDPQVAAMLTGMMNSPVITVPALARVPRAALADVYVFANGVRPDGDRGPFGYQPDVFGTVPGTSGYSPLRRVNLVTWRPGAQARVLRSLDEVHAAERAGRVVITRPGAVVNMPMVQWPGGQR